jgi:hypothetical protein
MASISSAAILATLFGASLFCCTKIRMERVIIAIAIAFIWLSTALGAAVGVGLKTHMQTAVMLPRLTGEIAIICCMLYSVARSRKRA